LILLKFECLKNDHQLIKQSNWFLYLLRVRISHWFHRLERWNQCVSKFLYWKIKPKPV